MSRSYGLLQGAIGGNKFGRRRGFGLGSLEGGLVAGFGIDIVHERGSKGAILSCNHFGIGHIVHGGKGFAVRNSVARSAQDDGSIVVGIVLQLDIAYAAAYPVQSEHIQFLLKAFVASRMQGQVAVSDIVGKLERAAHQHELRLAGQFILAAGSARGGNNVVADAADLHRADLVPPAFKVHSVASIAVNAQDIGASRLQQGRNAVKPAPVHKCFVQAGAETLQIIHLNMACGVLHVFGTHIQATSDFVREVNGLKALYGTFTIDVAQGQRGALADIEQIDIFAGSVAAAVNNGARAQGLGDVQGVIARTQCDAGASVHLAHSHLVGAVAEIQHGVAGQRFDSDSIFAEAE